MGGLDPKVLVLTAKLFDPGVENDEVVDDFEEPGLLTGLKQVPVQKVGFGGVWSVPLDPLKKVLRRGSCGAIPKPFRIIARQHPLYGGKEGLDELLRLVVEVLPDAFRSRDGGPLEFQHSQGDSIDVKDDVGPLVVGLDVGGLNGHLFGDGEVVVGRALPIDEPDRLCGLTCAWFDFDPVAKQFVDRSIAVVEALARVFRNQPELVHRLADQIGGNLSALQPFGEGGHLEVGVTFPVLPVAQVLVAQTLLEQSHDPVLGQLLDLTDGHGNSLGRAFLTASPFVVRRYCCLLLCGLSGMVISNSPASRAGRR